MAIYAAAKNGPSPSPAPKTRTIWRHTGRSVLDQDGRRRHDPPMAGSGNLSGAMRGTNRKISLPRRFIADLMHASMRVPFVSLSRTIDIRQLIEARAPAAQRPGWAAIFVKAFALVAMAI